MKTRQIQFNYQRMAALLLAGLIFTLAAGLAWSSTFQLAKTAQAGLYLPQSNYMGPPADTDCSIIVRGSKPGSTTDGVSFAGCESELRPRSQLRAV